MTLETRLVAYTPNGASQGVLPAPDNLEAAFPLNDTGALTIGYDPDSPRAALLGQPLEVGLEVSNDQGQTWGEPYGGRFLLLRDGRDPVQQDAWAISCPSYIFRLSKAIVPLTGLDADGQRTFTDMTVGAILHTLFTEAQGRGALAGLTWSFNAVVDSTGTAWGSTKTISYDPGKDLLSVLQEFADLGDVDYTTNGRAIQVYKGDSPTGMAVDTTTQPSPVTLRMGRDLTEAPFQRTWEGLADTAVVQGDNGTYVTRTNPGAIKPWGVQETLVSAGGVSDTGTLSVIGDAALAQTEGARVEYTHGLIFDQARYHPFYDYSTGAWVYMTINGSPERVRVTQVTVTRDDSGQVAGNVVLNDRFTDSDIRQARRLEALLNGATPTTGGQPTPVGNDILPPAQVLGLGVTSSAYLDPQGVVRSVFVLDWPDVTTNADGTPATDVDHYEVWGRESGGTFTLITQSQTSSASMSPYDPGDVWEFRVRAVDTVFNRGAFSTIVAQTAAADSVGPVKPSTPTGTTRLGTARIAWDGLSATAGPMNDDWAYTVAHLSLVNNFTPTDATRVDVLTGPGYVVAGPLNYNATYYARLVAYDTSGNASVVSDQVALVVVPLVDVSNFPDTAMDELFTRTGHFLDLTSDNFSANLIEGAWIKAGAITAEKVGALAITTDKLSVGANTTNTLLNCNFTDADPAVGGGSKAALWLGAGTIPAFREANAAAPGGFWLVLRATNSTASQATYEKMFPVVPGTTYALGITAGVGGGVGSLYLRALWFDAAGNPLTGAGTGGETLTANAAYSDALSGYALGNDYLPVTNQARLSGRVIAPTQAVYGAVQIHNYTPPVGAGVTCSMVVTEVSFNGMVNGVTIANGAIDGKTITGATVQTAASGERIVVRNDGSGGIIESYSGVASETPGYLDPSAVSGRPAIKMGAGTSPSFPEQAYVHATSGVTNASAITLFAKTTSTTGDMSVAGQLVVNGNIVSSAMTSAATSAAPNVFVNSGGLMVRTSFVAAPASAARFKKNRANARLTLDTAHAALDSIDIVRFDYRVNLDDENWAGRKGMLGVFADEAIGTPLENFVIHDTEGEVQSFDYGRAAYVLLRPIVDGLREQIDALTERLALLEG